MWTGEIEPAHIDQVRMKDGKRVVIEADVGGVVRQLQDIDSHLRVRWSDAGHYAVYWRPDGCPECNKAGYGRKRWEEGEGDLITTAKELDGRVVERVQQIDSQRRGGYNLADEIERIDKEADREAERAFSEKIGEAGQRLGHALRKDLGYDKDTIFVGKSYS